MSQGTTFAALIEHGPMTAEQIAEMTGYSKQVVDANLRRLRAEPWESVVVVDEIKGRKWAGRPVKVWDVRQDD